MANVLDVAAYILNKVGRVSTWKLQKLIYYAEAWHAVWDDKTLFPERIEAWANGPVAPALYERHKGQFTISTLDGGDPKCLEKNERESVDAVIKFYNKYNGQQLSEITHKEQPWLRARDGLAPNERGRNIIILEAMTEYYSGL